MPLYEYECKACGKVLEVRQKISDPAPSTCDACHGGPLAKLMSKTSFILKGGGWYVTDFRGGSSEGKRSEDAVAAPEAAKTDSPTPSKPASEATPNAPASSPAPSKSPSTDT